MKQERSQEILTKAQKFIPGGVNSPVRSFRGVGGNAFVAARADGAYLEDVDGNRYIDLVSSWGALIHGHNHPAIREAIVSALSKGTSFGVTSELEVELCDQIVQAVPGLDMVRLVNSGTEACMSAVRLARGATGRDLIIKFDGNYHGHGDPFLVAAGSGLATLQVADSAGVPKKTLDDTIVLSFNDAAAVEKVFADCGSKIAGVILEVVCGNMGVVLPEMKFLSALRSLTQKHGSVLIFDEVMTGFRLAREGVQAIYGVRPDLFTFGKVIGGGMPVGAYGGKGELMRMVAPLGPVYQAGTLSGNPLAAAAGLASLKLIAQAGNSFYQRLDSVARDWKSRVDAHCAFHGYPVSVVQQGSMVSLFFRSQPPRNYEEVKQSDRERFKKFFWALLEDGVYFPPSAFEACFLSAAHDAKIMDQVTSATLKAIDKAMAA